MAPKHNNRMGKTFVRLKSPKTLSLHSKQSSDKENIYCLNCSKFNLQGDLFFSPQYRSFNNTTRRPFHSFLAESSNAIRKSKSFPNILRWKNEFSFYVSIYISLIFINGAVIKWCEAST